MPQFSKRLSCYFASFFLILLVLAAFWKVGEAQFVNYDDNNYILVNGYVPHGLTWKGITWAFTTFYHSNWHPLTWISFMLDVHLFGLNPAAFHGTNLLFHAANTLLLFLVLFRMTGGFWQSLVVGALFAVHPLHVESVAWVSERKDVLSTFFMLLAIGSYGRYSAHSKKRGQLYLGIVLFALALMTKSMPVTLPLLLLLLDYWPLGRIPISADWKLQRKVLGGLVLEKLPLFALSLLAGVMTMLAQKHSGAMGDLTAFPFIDRLANAVWSYGHYILQMVRPVDLAVFYPYATVPIWKLAASGSFLLAVSLLCLGQYQKRPYLTVGWLWYLISFLPVIGLIQVGKQAMADRYTYIPLIGLFIIIAWGSGEWAQGKVRKVLLSAAAVLVVVGLTGMTQRQVTYWQNSLTLFYHTLDITQNNYVIHRNLGMVYNTQKRFQEATEEFVKSIRIKPDTLESFNDFGNDLAKKGSLEDALACYDAVLLIKPDFAPALFNSAIVLEKLGRPEDAIRNYEKVLRVMPQNEPARVRLEKLKSRKA